MSEKVGQKMLVSGALCQREVELVHCGVDGRPLSSNPGSNFAFANTLVSVRLCIRIENGNLN